MRPAPYAVSAWTPSISREQYEAAVREVRGHIANGDVRQVNYSFRLRAAFFGDPSEFYRDLVLAQRGANGAYFDLGRYHILSASPERFLQLEGRRIVTRPMKGTSRRGRWPAEDRLLAERLVTSQKTRAENLTIVDRLQKDLGKVAFPESVSVEELVELERYETVWQLISQVSAELGDDVGLGEVFSALFPSGSVTGAPRWRAMEIIADLERSARGTYCGSLGFVSPPDFAGPRARFSVGIRTVMLDVEEGLAEYGVGGAITWESSPAGEYEEARAKAQLLVERRPEFDLVEILRWDERQGFWWLDEHLERMAGSAWYFGFSFDREVLEEAARSAVAQSSAEARVRLSLNRDGKVSAAVDDRGLRPISDTPPSAADPVRAVVDDEAVRSSNVFLYHSTSLRRPYELRRHRHPEADEVLLCNERGEVTEATRANLVVRFGDEWWTPALESGCLPGTLRAVLLAKGEVRERAIALYELEQADELGLIDSLHGWRRAVLVDQ